MSHVIRAQVLLGLSIGLSFFAQAEKKLTPLKRGGGRPLESLKAKKEPKESVKPLPAKKDEAPSEARFDGPKSGWGIVSQASSFYSGDGHNQGRLPAGTLVAYSGVKTSTESFVLVSKIQRQTKTWEGPFLIEAPDVVLFSGALEEMPAQLIADLRAYYTLQGRIAERKAELEEKAQSRNPYFECAKRSQANYAGSVEKASVLEKQANALKGPAKIKILDELRSLKYEQARLKMQADKEALSYKAWKEQHPISPTLFTKDAELQALLAQRKAAKEKIKDVVVE